MRTEATKTTIALALGLVCVALWLVVVVGGPDGESSRTSSFPESTQASEPNEPRQPDGADQSGAPADVGLPSVPFADPHAPDVVAGDAHRGAGQLRPIENDATAPSATWTRPALLETRTDPVYGTPVTRVTSAEDTRFNRNTYSRRNPENANGTLFFSYHGEAEYRVYTVESAVLVAELTMHADAEPQWHPTNPLLVRHIAGPDAEAGDLRLYELNLATGTTTVIADLAGRLGDQLPGASYLYDRAEGAPSADGTRYAWLVFDDQDERLGAVSYDLATDTLVATRAVAGGGLERADWVSASPTGAHVMASGVDGTFVYDFDLTNERQIHDDGEHSDIALSSSGRDTYVYVDFSATTATAGWVVAKDLATGETTRLFDLYDDANTSIHISGKAYDRPGWVIMSTYNCKDLGAWSCDKVFAVDIESGAVVPLAHTYNCGASYWTEAHAATNRDMSRVYFNSDAGSCGIDAEVYRLDLEDRLPGEGGGGDPAQ